MLFEIECRKRGAIGAFYARVVAADSRDAAFDKAQAADYEVNHVFQLGTDTRTGGDLIDAYRARVLPRIEG